MSMGERSGEPLSNPTIGTAWLTTRRLGIAYMAPVLCGLTMIEFDPLVRSCGLVSSASSCEVSITCQPCCQPWYS